MKKLFIIFLGVAFVAGLCTAMAPGAFAKAPADTGTAAKQVKCCINGECKTMAEKACIDGGGKPVGDCKQCAKTK